MVAAPRSEAQQTAGGPLTTLTTNLAYASYFSQLDRVTAAGVTSPTSTLRLNSDRPDTSYYAVELGASAVFKQGFQAFLNARSLLGLTDANLLAVSAGIRAEF